jgi:hypothetical protein
VSPHILCIMSHYTDAAFSLRRLEITRATLTPSLRSQTRKPVLHIVVSPDDPHIDHRVAEFADTGCDCRFLYRPQWRLYGEDWEIPSGHCIVGRCDDDDVLSREFCEVTHRCGVAHPERAIIWPIGLVYWRGNLYRWEHPGNQFLTLSTSRGIDPHHKAHSRIQREWKSVRASLHPGTIWIRHGDAETSTLARYRQTLVGPDSLQGFAVDLATIDAAIQPSGIASANYQEHGSRARGMRVSQWLSVYGSDKVSAHNYGSFYDGIFSDIEPRAILEIGVLRGASLRAWQSARVPIVEGIDCTPRPEHQGLQVHYATMPDIEPIREQLGSYDLIIDDGSHRADDYTATAAALWQHLRPGGRYIIEDIQTQADADRLSDEGWSLYDWRRQTGRWDDLIAMKTR